MNLTCAVSERRQPLPISTPVIGVRVDRVAISVAVTNYLQ